MKTNTVTVSGNLTRDPETRTANSGTTICRFSIAHNHNQDKASFFDVTAFGKAAEAVNQYLGKGSGCIVTGRLEQETWEDRNGGGQRSKIVIIASNVEFFPRSANEAPQRRERDETAPNPSPRRETPAEPAYGDDFSGSGDDAVTDDDLPF